MGEVQLVIHKKKKFWTSLKTIREREKTETSDAMKTFINWRLSVVSVKIKMFTIVLKKLRGIAGAQVLIFEVHHNSDK